jgi:hypothetical protein
MEQKVPKTRRGSLRSDARQHHVSHTTIHRDRLFTRAVDIIAASVGAKPIEMLRGDVKLGKQEWQMLAEIAKYTNLQP